MELAYVKLDDGQVREALTSIPGWKIDDGKLAKTFEFEAYQEGVLFAAAVGVVADHLNHHPDIHIGYRKATISVNTHDVGGISPFDFELARRIEALML